MASTRETRALDSFRNTAGSLSLSKLITGLHSLIEGPAYLGQLIAYGPGAIPALSGLLLRGKPSSVYQPRQLVVEALGALGAFDVLLSYLQHPLDIPSTIVRHAEEAVQNTAARELAACRNEEVYTVLLDCLRTHSLPGVVETIGSFHRPETASYLIDCLEDDVCRSAAVEALGGFGDSIRELLVESASIRNPPLPDFESPSSIRRRRCCARLLERLQVTEQEVNRLRPLLCENDADLVVAVAHVLVQSPRFANFASVLFHLNRVKSKAEWWLRDELAAFAAEVEAKLSSNGHGLEG